ncbi:GntR family transcriptional regulator [Bacillaceae bacterium]
MEGKKNPILAHMAIQPESVKSLRDIALEKIRSAIIAGEFKPGDHLKERELAQAMGISTTPIKEALRILNHEGLVETLPRKGTFVSKMVDSSIEEVLMLKANLEGFCARLAAVKMTEGELQALESQVRRMEQLMQQKEKEQLVEANTQFHMMIRSAAKNPIIYQMVMNVVAFDKAFRSRALQYHVEIEEGFTEHKLIFEAIRQRDPDLAEARMKAHIMRTAENVLKNLKIQGS